MSRVTMSLEKRGLEDCRSEERSEKSKEARVIKQEAILMSVIRTKNQLHAKLCVLERNTNCKMCREEIFTEAVLTLPFSQCL